MKYNDNKNFLIKFGCIDVLEIFLVVMKKLQQLTGCDF